MKKFVATAINCDGDYIVERWNELLQKYERHLPKDINASYTKEVAEILARECNALTEM